MVVSLGSDMVHTAYLYLGIHFFILSTMMWAIATRWDKFSVLFKNGLKGFYSRWPILIGITIVIIFILAPYICIQLFCLKDFAIDSGAHSRLTQMWSIHHYFHDLPLNLASYQELFWFRRMLDFTIMPGMSFFWGYMFFFLSAVGLMMGRDSRKWIFISTIILLWMVNCPPHFISISLLGHWINVLTNPLKTMVRSYHMATHSILPYLFMPLALMGIEAIREMALGKKVPKLWGRWVLTLLMMGALVVMSYSYLPGVGRVYLLLFSFSSAIALTMLIINPVGPCQFGIYLCLCFYFYQRQTLCWFYTMINSFSGDIRLFNRI